MTKPLKTAELMIASGANADLRYISGFSAPDSFLWFRCGDECAVVVSPLEFGRAQTAVKPGVQVMSLESLGVRSWVDAALEIASEMGKKATVVEMLPQCGKDVFFIYTHGAPKGDFLKGIRGITKQKNCKEIWG